jgi:hypothetical protein
MHKQQIFDLLRRSSAFLMLVSSFISALLSDASVVGCIIEADGAVELTIRNLQRPIKKAIPIKETDKPITIRATAPVVPKKSAPIKPAMEITVNNTKMSTISCILFLPAFSLPGSSDLSAIGRRKR